MGVHELVIAVLSVFIGAYLFTGKRRRFIYLLYKTLPRDVLGAYRFVRVNVLLWWWEWQNFTVAKLFTRHATANPDKIAFIFEDKEWSYRELEEYSNQLGRYFHGKSLSREDSVGLILESRPEYVGIWLGLSKAGLVGALLNTNLRQDVLVHSIKAANCKAVIFGSNFKDAINEIRERIPNVALYQWSELPDTPCLEGAIDLNPEISNVDSSPLDTVALGTPRDKLIYIYTSGTTGMPKAAVITNLRYMLMSCGVNSMLNLRPTDRIYNSLPLYHTAGGLIGVGQALLRGITVVLRRRFSASKFWSDCVHYECTIAQYIGEICRYLLTAPSASCDTTHKVRLMFGNGLRPQIWKPFVERFGVKQIGEFYGATEGNSNLVNIDNKIGAVGFVPLCAGSLYPVALLRVDEETGEPLREPDGLCIRCKPGESGIFVGKINPKRVLNDFSGYVDRKASEQKILRDVFRKGDRVFNSGDILLMDEFGYFYFKDRTGDTFRWHGENVATSEVEAVVSNLIGLKDAAVYGVEVPGTEGKAGMAAVYDPENTLNIKEMAEGLKKSLPSYARPLFVRVLSELPMTVFILLGTFKLKKKDLQEDGFNIKKVSDPIYFLDNSGVYVKLTEEIYNNILDGKIRL
ncbi:fatty acid transport protein 3 isoform X1 [Bombus vancouverensis nearcticus]|uniref:Very long-chain fatty acid transport protein n=1 Tax=Bombus bifarius TaxID=103933 RepID=A0A6P8LZR7_9HYME|nr:long-chain fatty acid transport protein 4 isoform X1 [Bombus vancouverensis nearcticus]XP_033306616.1 long-chain fatty acid transport protein 4-like isoform X1 [Bombus bifarius]XP_050478514.1 long-chain fatty acid transport protein 4 [Bombus huntii]